MTLAQFNLVIEQSFSHGECNNVSSSVTNMTYVYCTMYSVNSEYMLLSIDTLFEEAIGTHVVIV
jgi:hypothetical protein